MSKEDKDEGIRQKRKENIEYRISNTECRRKAKKYRISNIEHRIRRKIKTNE